MPETVLAEALGIELPGAGDGTGERSRRLEIQAAGGTIVTGGFTFPFRDGIAWGPSLGVAFKPRRFASAIVFDNAFVVNFRPDEPEYMVYMPSIGVQF